MQERLLTPSKVTAWLDCAHYLSLRNQVDDGLLANPGQPYGSFAKLLADKGTAHEKDCLADCLAQGKTVLEIPDRPDRNTFADWTRRVGNPLNGEWDVVYQMPFVHDGMRGIADFLIRVELPETGAVSYEPVDAKLARKEAKPGHVLQLCFYADAIEVLTGVRPQHMHLWLGSGRMETLRVDDFSPYWRRLRSRLAKALNNGPINDTEPEPCTHCAFCEFAPLCDRRWREDDALHYVAGIRKPDRAALAAAGIPSLAELAAATEPVEGLRLERLTKLAAQAKLQVRSRSTQGPPPYELIAPGPEDIWGHGFEELPQPDDGDVFLDFEGHPFWRADTGLFFLFGMIERDIDGEWRYREWWAHDPAEEAVAVGALIDYLAARREQFPGMHVYHYNHTERSSLITLTGQHGVGAEQLASFISTGLFVDLFVVARNAIQVGTESYGLKHLERLTGFERGHDIDKGAGAVLEYEKYMAGKDRTSLKRIASYNEDDVRATRALRDWLLAIRSSDTPWRAALLESDPKIPDLDNTIATLNACGPGTTEYFLGDVLGYWTREWLAYVVPLQAKLEGDPAEAFDDPGMLAGLRPDRPIETTGKQREPRYRFSFESQPQDEFPPTGGSVLFVTPEGARCTTGIDKLSAEDRHLDLIWGPKVREHDHLPSTVAVDDWVSAKSKSDALSAFAVGVLDGSRTSANSVTMSLLLRELPRFSDGFGPEGRTFSDDLNALKRLVTHLDHSYLAVQGPPGTGKTYTAAHLVHALIRAGKRVGITAVSHAAIANLLKEVDEVFRSSGDVDMLRAVRNTREEVEQAWVTKTDKNNVCARPCFNLVAGTTWAFSSEAMRGAPVDVLLVDEAGQLALADTLAASTAAHNLILLGDPQQLAQVSRAVHPNGSGSSTMEYVLGGEGTMPPDRGVFLSTTWRMHPDVCDFISNQSTTAASPATLIARRNPRSSAPGCGG